MISITYIVSVGLLVCSQSRKSMVTVRSIDLYRRCEPYLCYYCLPSSPYIYSSFKPMVITATHIIFQMYIVRMGNFTMQRTAITHYVPIQREIVSVYLFFYPFNDGTSTVHKNAIKQSIINNYIDLCFGIMHVRFVF